MPRRRRKRKNPAGNRPGLGAFLGSVVGGIPGHIITALGSKSVGTLVTELGWIGGGAVGGRLGAKSDRKRRGTIGGAVGGIFTPLGAALGGYIGGRKADARRSNARKMNPSGTAIAIAVGTGVAAVGAGYGLYRATKGGTVFPGKKKQLEPAEALQGVVGNSTLEEASFMVSDIAQPIVLRTTPDPLPTQESDRVPNLRIKIVRPAGEATVEEPAGAAFGPIGDMGGPNDIYLIEADGDFAFYPMPKKAISYLITGLSTGSAQLAYELALIYIGDKGVNWADPEQRDAAIEQILVAIAPKMDWSQRLKPHTYGDRAWQAWAGVETVGTVAHQSFFNKQVLGEAQA